MEPVPVQDIARINASPTSRVITGPELRTIFLGMDQKRDELLYSSVKGKNPFKDKRVRQAFYQAIDIAGIQRTIMRGASRPTALLVGPGINGWTEAQDKRLPYDIEAAKKLYEEARILIQTSLEKRGSAGELVSSIQKQRVKWSEDIHFFIRY